MINNLFSLPQRERVRVRGLEYPLIEQLNPKWNDELKKYRRYKQQDKKG